MTSDDLAKFIDAQKDVYEQALAELKSGKKQSHWMWFIFPQLAGLGHSMRANYYGLTDMDQAKQYLADSVLGERLRDCVRAMLPHRDKSSWDILGSPDNWKFKSCLTLFELAATDDGDRDLFRAALQQFHSGERDKKTFALLGDGETSDAEGPPPQAASIDAIKNPSNKQIIAMIRSSSGTAARRIVCERSGDTWCWPAEKASHAEGARIVGAAYTQPPGGEILTLDD
jgi:uncharacterized protein (DUF1810 family)